MTVKVQDVKKLREETGAGVMDAKSALEESGGNFEEAKKLLIKRGVAKAAKKASRETKAGLVHSYIHAGGRAGSLVVVACETDFVAATDDFVGLCDEIAMQVCAMDYESVEELLADEYIRDSGKRVGDLVTEVIAKVGENIEVRDFVKFSV